jgi:hypothetical protein
MFPKPHGELEMYIYSGMRACVDTFAQVSSLLATQRTHNPFRGYFTYKSSLTYMLYNSRFSVIF